MIRKAMLELEDKLNDLALQGESLYLGIESERVKFDGVVFHGLLHTDNNQWILHDVEYLNLPQKVSINGNTIERVDFSGEDGHYCIIRCEHGVVFSIDTDLAA